MALISVCFIAALFFVGVLAQNPGFQIGLTNKGLDYVRQVAVPILIKELQTLAVPDIHGDENTPVGHVSYDLTHIHVNSVSLPTSSILVNTVGLAVSISGLSLSMGANWHYREDSWPHITDHGSCDISASGVSVAVTVSIGVSPTHEPTVNTASCSSNIGKLDITFHGGASWLYNLFSGFIADALKSSLNGQICDIIKNEINVEGNKVLATLPVQEKIDQYSAINFELISAPALPGDYIATRHKGEFFSIAKPVESPFVAPGLPLPASGTLTRMFYVWISGYLLESAGWVYEQVGVLNYTIQPSMVPASFPLQLNTSSFKAFIPALYAAYPNMAMQADIFATGNPLTVTIAPSGMMVVGTATIGFNVIQPNKTVTPNVFAIDVLVFADGRVWVAGDGTHNSIAANLSLVNVSMTLASSTIGPVKLAPLQFVLNIFTSLFLLPSLNKQLNKGFVIPVVDGITFVNPQVTLADGFLLIDTDVNYTPSIRAINNSSTAAPSMAPVAV